MPGVDGLTRPQTKGTAGRELVVGAAAERIAHRSAAQEPGDPRARRRLGQVGQHDERGQSRVTGSGDDDVPTGVAAGDREGGRCPARGRRSGPPPRSRRSPADRHRRAGWATPRCPRRRPRRERRCAPRHPLVRTCTVNGSVSRPASTSRSRPRRATPTTRAPKRTRSPSAGSQWLQVRGDPLLDRSGTRSPPDGTNPSGSAVARLPGRPAPPTARTAGREPTATPPHRPPGPPRAPAVPSRAPSRCAAAARPEGPAPITTTGNPLTSTPPRWSVQ